MLLAWYKDETLPERNLPQFPSLLSFPLPTSYLRQCALCLPQLDEDPEWDTQHGGQSHEPADAIAPSRVCVHVVVLEWLVLDQKEDEDTLWRGRWRVLVLLLSPTLPQGPRHLNCPQ